MLRGEAGQDSDMDLLIRLDDDRSLFDLIDFWHDLEDLLNCKVDAVTEAMLSPYFRDRVVGEAVALCSPAPGL